MGSLEMESKSEMGIAKKGKPVLFDLGGYLKIGSLDMKKGSKFIDEGRKEEKKTEMGIQKKENKKIKRSPIFPLFGCMRLDDDDDDDVDGGRVTVVETPSGEGSFNLRASQKGRAPPHLVVMVNGIVGSANNWKYAAKQFVKAYPRDVIVHCSESNYSTLTFDGVDVMGIRLAEEVVSVIEKHPYLQKISFVGHSLGGLICRYAIAKLYEQGYLRGVCGEDTERSLNGSRRSSIVEVSKRKIIGLEPVNFITCATPHLGCRGHKQVPVFRGIHSLEKAASSISWLLGKTGTHLFLKDRDEGKPPLLLRMTTDSEELPFISSLQSFKRRAVYANTSFDHLVGWSTSSLRRRNELPKRRELKRTDKYPHIVSVADGISSAAQEETPEVKINRCKPEEMEEAMIRGLTKLSWERVDVSFKGSIQRLWAHTTIQVKNYCASSDGADVIQHMIDNFVVHK